jgi:hypothetical protein
MMEQAGQTLAEDRERPSGALHGEGTACHLSLRLADQPCCQHWRQVDVQQIPFARGIASPAMRFGSVTGCNLASLHAHLHRQPI